MSSLVHSFFRWGKIDFSLEITPNLNWQENIYHQTVGSEIVKMFPVDQDYCLKFCKNVIKFCEEHNEEVSDLFYDKLSEIQMNLMLTECDFYKTYFLSNSYPNMSISLRESKAVISGGTTGLSSWHAGERMARWLDSDNNVKMLQGKIVLELGAGSGITGLFSIMRCKEIKEYIMTDCHEKVLDNLKHNVQVNLSQKWTIDSVTEDSLKMKSSEQNPDIRIAELNWEEFSDATEFNADVILGADIVYDPQLLPSLVNTLVILLEKSANTVSYLSCCVRNEATWMTFRHQVEKAGLFFDIFLTEESTYGLVHIVKITRYIK